MVLIETLWNVNEEEDRQWSARRQVLIETLWNVNQGPSEVLLLSLLF